MLITVHALHRYEVTNSVFAAPCIERSWSREAQHCTFPAATYQELLEVVVEYNPLLGLGSCKDAG